MANEDKSALVQFGDRFSAGTSRLFAHPYMQAGVMLFCAFWFLLGFDDNLLTAALSVVAITLTQMVLNGQYAREAEAFRRDIAMHAKLDELIIATKRARDEMVGIEELEEEQIRQLTEQAKQEIVAQGERDGDQQEREEFRSTQDETAANVRAQARRR